MSFLQNWFFWVFVLLYTLHLLVEVGLDILDLRSVQQHQDKIPSLFQGVFSPEDYRKSIEYTRAKTRFGWVQNLWGLSVLWFFILSGSFYSLDQWLSTRIPESSLWHQVAYPFLIGGIFYLLNLPFGIYFQFVLEERFGFNKTKAATYFLDQIKTVLIALILGVPLLILIFWLVGKMGTHWWIAGWGVMLGFQFLTAALFPVLLAPLFYKFSPLEAGDLKQRLHALAEKIKFKMSGIFTIDGSRRSTHSNAFFAGMGKARRIVLFDTLVKNLSTDEIVSVIGHEMGHNKLKHVQKGLILSALTSLFGFWVLAFCLTWPLFFQAFGVPVPSLAVGFVLFGLLSGVFAFPLNPLFKWISRKHEYEADRFSVAVLGDKPHMISSLVKLSKDNLSNLTPHPWYSFYHYSHPTTTERAQAIEKL